MPSPASPEKNNFRCDACGRRFNTLEQLRGHEADCAPARQTTQAGRRELEDQRSHSPAKNDAGSNEHPFQHGRH
jgi:hypothetical protein